MPSVRTTRLSLVLAARPVRKRRVETPHWRNVRTAQGGVAANGCPPSAWGANRRREVRIRATETSRGAGQPGSRVKRAISTRSNTK